METNAGWVFGETPARAEYVTDRYLSPYRSVLLGLTNEPNVHSYSSMQQLVNVPMGSKLTLRAHVYPQSHPYDGDDAQELIIMNATGQPLRRVLTSVSDARAWQTLEFDLSEFMGMPISIYFNVFNDGAGGVTSMYIDDVTLEVCYGYGTTASPTSTPTTTILTATPTPTPHIVTATPTPIVVTNTPTPTPTPGFITATPTPIVVTNTPTPLPFVTATPTPIVVTNTPTPPPVFLTATPTATFVVITPSTPMATWTPPPVTTPIPPGVDCDEVVFNGGFEFDGGWQFGDTKLPAGYSGIFAHNGLRSMRLGNADYAAPNKRSYSSIQQRISLRRPGKTTATLSFWYYPISDLEPGDAQEAILLDARTNRTIAVLWRTNENLSRWSTPYQPIDLTRYLGRDVILYFNVFNDGGVGRAAMYLDDVSLLVCGPALPTPTPTALASASPLLYTSTPTASATPLAGGAPPLVSELASTPTPIPPVGKPIAPVQPTFWQRILDAFWAVIILIIALLIIIAAIVMIFIQWREAVSEDADANENPEFHADAAAPAIRPTQEIAPFEAPEDVDDNLPPPPPMDE